MKTVPNAIKPVAVKRRWSAVEHLLLILIIRVAAGLASLLASLVWIDLAVGKLAPQ